MSGSIDVSVIIVNYNGLRYLKQCLPSLIKTETVSFEIIVVDNGSADESLEWLSGNYPKVRTIDAQKNLGFGRANELGVASANGEKIAFLNNDTQVDPDWLITMVTAMDGNPRITAACSRLMLLEHPEILNAMGGGMSRLGYGFDHFFGLSYRHNTVKQLHDHPTVPVFFPTAAAMLMSKEKFEALGGFDKSFFMYHEDVDFGWRIWLSGGEVHVCPDSIVYHQFGGTTSKVYGNSWRNRLGMRHNVRTLIKCYRKKNAVAVLREHFHVWKERKAWDEMRHVIWWNLVRLPGTLMERVKIQKNRVPSDEVLFERGLISDTNSPAMMPLMHKFSKSEIQQFAIRSSRLSMADEVSSASRLGPGWYFVEALDGRRVRWTTGDAECCLKVASHAAGRLELQLFLPGQSMDATAGSWVEIACGNKVERFQFAHHSGWNALELEVEADETGVLAVAIQSSTWSPHLVFNNGDKRILGCAVERIAFRGTRDALHNIRDDTEEADSLTEDACGVSTEIGGTANVAKGIELSNLSLTLIIPTYNRKTVLIECLEALKKQTLPHFQVIVVDDGSTDGTLDALENWKTDHHDVGRFELIILTQKNQKQGQARNHGLQFATGDVVMFIGDDIIPAPDCLETHMRKHAQLNPLDNDIAILGFTDWDRAKMNVSPFLEFINGHGAQFGYELMRSGDDVPFTCFYTSHISMKRSILGKTPFDLSFQEYGWEDIDLGYRLCKEGLRIVYTPEAKAVHHHPTDMLSFLKRQRKVGFAVETMLKIHPELRHNRHLPEYASPGIKGKLLTPLWKMTAWGINYLDLKKHKRFSHTIYHWLISYPFHQGWSERLALKK